MIDIHIYQDKQPNNLIAPFFVSGIIICDPKPLRELYKSKTVQNIRKLEWQYHNFLIRDTANILDIDPKCYYLQILEVTKTEIETLGLDIAFKRKVDQCTFILKMRYIKDTGHLFNFNVNLSNKAEDLESIVNYTYCHGFRRKYIIRYAELFSQLNIYNHYGEDNKSHLDKLYNLKLLPDFYLKEKTFKAMSNYLNNQEPPIWFKLMLQEYINNGFDDQSI